MASIAMIRGPRRIILLRTLTGSALTGLNRSAVSRAGMNPSASVTVSIARARRPQMAYPPMSVLDHGLTDALVGIRDPESAEVKNGVTRKSLLSLNVYLPVGTSVVRSWSLRDRVRAGSRS